MSERELSLFRVQHPAGIGRDIAHVFASGYIAEGPRVREFERQLGLALKRDVVAVNSCTSALTLALVVAGVGTNSVVLTTPMTCAATNTPILNLGAIPVWVDIDPCTGLMDPEDALRVAKRYPEARTLVCVDWGGMQAPIDLLSETGLFIIEDAAHAFDGVDPDRRPADVCCYSFQAIKHLTTGDGGALAFSGPQSAGIRGLAKRLRWFGIDREAVAPGDSRIELDIPEAGYKFHMNDLAATIGLANLPRAIVDVKHYRAWAAYLAGHLDPRFERMSSDVDTMLASWWIYTVLLPKRGLQESFRVHMRERGVQVSQVHRRNDEYSCFSPYQRELPGVTEFSERMMCLPCHSDLEGEDVEHIVAAANDFAMRNF